MSMRGPVRSSDQDRAAAAKKYKKKALLTRPRTNVGVFASGGVERGVGEHHMRLAIVVERVAQRAAERVRHCVHDAATSLRAPHSQQRNHNAALALARPINVLCGGARILQNREKKISAGKARAPQAHALTQSSRAAARGTT